jgi:hypothetical protein
VNPVILTGTISGLAANVVGSMTDERALQNWTKSPLRVDEIHFQPINDMGTIPSAPVLFEIQMRVGNAPITNGFISLYSMTWPKERAYEHRYRGRRISFSKPVYLAPGERIHVLARHSATGQTWDLEVLAWTRATPAIRLQHFLPWICGYTSVARVENAGVFSEQIGRDVFNNSFNVPIHVERFIGRMFYNAEEIEGETILSVGSTNTAIYRFPYDQVRVRIEDHLGNKVVRDRTPFGVVFEGIRKSWVVNVLLQPKGFYNIALEGTLATIIGTNTVQSFVGMLAYRPAGVE